MGPKFIRAEPQMYYDYNYKKSYLHKQIVSYQTDETMMSPSMLVIFTIDLLVCRTYKWYRRRMEDCSLTNTLWWAESNAFDKS